MAFNASLLDIPFLGPVVPKEVVKAVPVVKSVEDSDYETILNFTVAYLQGEESDAQEEQHWNKVLENTNLGNQVTKLSLKKVSRLGELVQDLSCAFISCINTN
tara:strand:- start:554 stop:862 length:309 start_codon:yes stop_codon:yes gene_type:complete